MFRMLPGFLNDPPGLNGLDDPACANDSSGSLPANAESCAGPRGLTLAVGDDNPFFDLRRPGDPGGVGFVRVHSQLQVVDLGSTSVCLGLQAWTPAGLQSGGVADGPTVLAPGLGIFHDLGDGTGLHGYVGQHLRGTRQGPLNYGMALQCPLAPWVEPADRCLFVFVQALGTYDYVGDRQGKALNWEVVPGIHWRINDNFWMSLGASKLGMLTCSWQY
jgi:hypothetical protein